jgi:hypothetical protein
VVLWCAGIFWLVSAHKWFKGPTAQSDAAQLAAIEGGSAHIQAELEEAD